jgi:hypothetical protein
VISSKTFSVKASWRTLTIVMHRMRLDRIRNTTLCRCHCCHSLLQGQALSTVSGSGKAQCSARNCNDALISPTAVDRFPSYDQSFKASYFIDFVKIMLDTEYTQALRTLCSHDYWRRLFVDRDNHHVSGLVRWLVHACLYETISTSSISDWNVFFCLSNETDRLGRYSLVVGTSFAQSLFLV